MISQSTDKRKELLAAALKLFAEYGFHGTPTSKIAKEAGVANGTLFHYYKTKEDLIVSLYLDIKLRMSDYIETKAAPGSNAKEKFRNQFEQVIVWSLKNRDEFYFMQQFSSSPFAALLSPEEIQKQLSKSCRQIEEAIAEKAIRNRDVSFILTVMSSHIFGLSQYMMKSKLTQKEQQTTINDSFDMLWTMLS